MTNPSQQQWKDRPAPKLSVHRLRVDTLEASTKFEGRWVCQGALDDSRQIKFWMSFKQAGSLHKNLDAETLYCVVDFGDPEKPRFVWASNSLEWLTNSFCNGEKAKAPQAAPQSFESTPATVKPAAARRTTWPKRPIEPNRFESGDEELPF